MQGIEEGKGRPHLSPWSCGHNTRPVYKCLVNSIFKHLGCVSVCVCVCLCVCLCVWWGFTWLQNPDICCLMNRRLVLAWRLWERSRKASVIQA